MQCIIDYRERWPALFRTTLDFKDGQNSLINLAIHLFVHALVRSYIQRIYFCSALFIMS